MTAVEDTIKTCAVCGTDSKESYVKECHFCKKLICTSCAHYVNVKETTVSGVSNKTIRVCVDCKPQR